MEDKSCLEEGLFLISTSPSIITFYLISMTVSDFRPVQMCLLRPNSLFGCYSVLKVVEARSHFVVVWQ